MVSIYRFLAALLLVMSSQFAYAFDEKRHGIILGLGAGLHNIDIDFETGSSVIASDSRSGIATSFKIGGGITNQFALYYVRNASWYRAPSSGGGSTSDIVYTVGISGVGATFFLRPSAPSVYLLAAAGVGDISAPLEDDIDTDTGDAFMIGGGYEVHDHLQFEGTLLMTDIGSADVSNLDMETASLQLTINYLWY